MLLIFGLFYVAVKFCNSISEYIRWQKGESPNGDNKETRQISRKRKFLTSWYAQVLVCIGGGGGGGGGVYFLEN